MAQDCPCWVRRQVDREQAAAQAPRRRLPRARTSGRRGAGVRRNRGDGRLGHAPVLAAPHRQPPVTASEGREIGAMTPILRPMSVGIRRRPAGRAAGRTGSARGSHGPVGPRARRPPVARSPLDVDPPGAQGHPPGAGRPPVPAAILRDVLPLVAQDAVDLEHHEPRLVLEVATSDAVAYLQGGPRSRAAPRPADVRHLHDALCLRDDPQRHRQDGRCRCPAWAARVPRSSAAAVSDAASGRPQRAAVRGAGSPTGPPDATVMTGGALARLRAGTRHRAQGTPSRPRSTAVRPASTPCCDRISASRSMPAGAEPSMGRSSSTGPPATAVGEIGA